MNNQEELVIWISNYGGWNWRKTQASMIKVVFPNDEIAANYIATHGHLVIESDVNNDFEKFPKALNALNPICEHGLSLTLCAGFNHYPDNF